MARNIYGLPAWQFKIMKMIYEALPEDQKKKVAEAEQNIIVNTAKAMEENLVAQGFEKIDEGKFLRQGRYCKKCNHQPKDCDSFGCTCNCELNKGDEI